MPLFVLEPPVHYVHRYNGPVIERVLPLSESRKACAARGVHADACAWTSNGACHLIIPSNGPVRNIAVPIAGMNWRIATVGITPTSA